jgi:hypothetical protein
MNELTDDSVLRALRQLPEVAPDEAFVTAVSARVQARRRQLLGLYALLGVMGLAGLVLLAPVLLQLAGVLAAAPILLLPVLQSMLQWLPLAGAAAVLGVLWTWQHA